MKNRKKAFYIIFAAVLITGLIFSLYAFSKIRSIRELRAAIEKSGTERLLSIEKESKSSTGVKKSTLKGTGTPLRGVNIPQKMWTTEFIEIVYSASQKYGIRDLTFEQKSVDGSRRQTQGNGRLTLQSYPLKMTFHAGYREMAEFIQELQGLERLVTIDSLRAKREKSYLSVEITATTYAMEGK